MIAKWRDFLCENASQWKLPKGQTWDFLMLNVTHPMGNTIYLLWFQDGRTYPDVVTKLSSQERFLRTEFQNLLDAYACAPAWAPRPLAFSHDRGLWALWMEGVPGFKLFGDGRNMPLKPIVRILADMHKAIRDRGNWPNEDRYRRFVLEPLESVAQENDDTIIAGCAELRARTSAEWICSLPVMPQHCDFFPGNLLKHKDQIHVVDWEYFGRINLPLFDVVTLVVSALKMDTEDRDRDGFSSPVAKEIPILLDSYTGQLGLSRGDVVALLPLCLLNWCHLLRQEGHTASSSRVYGALRHYFEHKDLWEGLFVRSGSPH